MSSLLLKEMSNKYMKSSWDRAWPFLDLKIYNLKHDEFELTEHLTHLMEAEPSVYRQPQKMIKTAG